MFFVISWVSVLMSWRTSASSSVRGSTAGSKKKWVLYTCATATDKSLCILSQYIHPLNGPLSGTTRVNRYQKGKTNLDFTGARDSEWQWHQLGHMQICMSLQTNNHASTPPLSFLQAGCPSCRPTNSVKALKAFFHSIKLYYGLLFLIFSHSSLVNSVWAVMIMWRITRFSMLCASCLELTTENSS